MRSPFMLKTKEGTKTAAHAAGRKTLFIAEARMKQAGGELRKNAPGGEKFSHSQKPRK